MTVYFRDRTEEEDRANPVPATDDRGIVGAAGDAIANANPGMAIARWALNPQTQSDQITNYRYGRYRDNMRGEALAREDVYDDANDEIFRVTGTRLPNPERGEFLDPLSLRGTGLQGSIANDPYLQWHARLAEMARSDPRLARLYERYGTVDNVTTRARSLRQGVTQDYHDYLGNGSTVDQLTRGLMGAPGMIVGGVSSGSPEQVAQLGAGAGGRGLNLLERTVRGSLMGVLGQAAVEPAIIDDARRMGEEYPDRQVWLDYLLAAGFGATLDVGGGVVERAFDPPRIELDTNSPIQELASVFERWNGAPPQDVLDRFAQSPPGEELQRVFAGQAESLVVSSHARDAMIARTFPDLADQDIVATADEIVANQRFVNGEDEFPSRTGQSRRADATEIEAARRISDDTPMPEPGTRETIRMGGRDRPRTFERFNAADLRFDPQTFQYKQSEGSTGSTGVLAGVEQWDNQSSGKIIVFEAADGTQYVADGHQRTALAQAIAQRDGSQIMLDGVLYRESEGWTAREVRNLAAQKNLRETPGDPIDTAQLIREAPELIDSSVPQRSAGFRVARGLAALSDEAFRAVRAGQIEPRLGAAIGEVAAGRPETHEPLARLFADNPPRTIREATFIAHEAMQAEVFRVQTAQMSMFGDAPELAGMRERASILGAAATQLRQDRRLFEIASRNAEELEAAGNVIAREENARRADLSEALLRHLDMLATRPSEVSRLLREVAATAAEQKLSPSVAANRFVNGVIDLFNSRGLVGLMQEQAPPVRAPEPINTPMLPRVEEEERASVLRSAHDADDEARAQSLAEVAVERALRGEVGDDIPLDAIGYTPEADLARIERALDALGVDDPTVAPVAAALYARPTPDMELEARTRLTGEQTSDAPRSFAEVAEQSAEPEIFNPLDIEDETALLAKIDGATLPQLDKIQRTFGLYGAGDGSRTRTEFRAAFMQEWRDVYGQRGFFSKAPDAGSGGVSNASSAPDGGPSGAGRFGTPAPEGDQVLYYFGAEPGVAPYRQQYGDEITQRIAGRNWTTETVRLDSLRGLQDSVSPTFRDVPAQGFDGKPPIVVRYRGQNYIENGTHRLVAAAERGDPSARVAVIDLDNGRAPDAPNAGNFALREPSMQSLSTVADWTRAVQREFPRYGKKLLERARLIIVQSADELPDGGRGFYARLFEGVSKPEQRARIAESLEHVRLSHGGPGTDLTDMYAWRASNGRVMAAEMVSVDPRLGAAVSFGVLEPGGIRISEDDFTGNIGNAVENISVAMAAVERDIQTNRRAIYRFTGASPAHTRVYARLMRAMEPPPGYIKATVISDSGGTLSFVILREDIAAEHNITSTITLDQAYAMHPRTTMPRSVAMDEKQTMLRQEHDAAIQALADKASVPPRPGAFARGRGVIGYSEGGQSWIVADNASVELARGLTLHEIGVHVGMKDMLGAETFDLMMSEVQRLYDDGDADIRAGRNAVPRDTPESQIWEETLAYAIQNADEGSMSTGFRGVVTRVLNSIRAWLWKNVPAFRDMTHLTFEDMQFLALGGLRHAASTNPRMIDTRSLPTRIRERFLPKPRLLQDAVADAGSGWLNARLFHGKSDRPGVGMTFMSPSAKIAGLYGEIEAYEVRGPIHDASDELIRTQDDFNRVVAEARKAGATGVYTSALDRGKLGAQEQIVMFDADAVRPAGSGRVDMSNPASVALAEADNMDRVMTMLEHCQ